jgi:hypothetical protein
VRQPLRISPPKELIDHLADRQTIVDGFCAIGRCNSERFQDVEMAFW